MVSSDFVVEPVFYFEVDLLLFLNENEHMESTRLVQTLPYISSHDFMVQSGWTKQKKNSLAQNEIKISRRYTGSFIACACVVKSLMR
jgi:hypothetical protein